MITIRLKPLETLHGNGKANDAPALRILFNGGCVHDNRDGGCLISAPTLAALPPGLYRLIDGPVKDATHCGRAA